MKSKRNKQDVADTERLFQALVDSGILSFPRLEEPTHTQRDALTARMKKALQERAPGSYASAPELFRARRIELNLSVSDVITRTGISDSTYRALEDGVLAPTDIQPEQFARVLFVLGVTFSNYLDVHSSSIREGHPRSRQRRVALRGQRDRASAARRHSRPVSNWLTRLNIEMELLSN